MAFASGQLAKLTVIFSPFDEIPGYAGIAFNPMYNPESYSMNHSLDYDENQRPLIGDLDKKFLRIKPKSLALKLFFDGTNASPSNFSRSEFGAFQTPDFNNVVAQVEMFLTLAARISGISVDDFSSSTNSERHQPMKMMIVWGTFLMTGVLSSASVKYTMFDNDGVPIRAEMDITVDEAADLSLIEKEIKLNSPDLSKSITVKQGDTLPDLCFKEYGDASLYPKIAEVNELTNFRKLKPGTELLFPPIK